MGFQEMGNVESWFAGDRLETGEVVNTGLLLSPLTEQNGK